MEVRSLLKFEIKKYKAMTNYVTPICYSGFRSQYDTDIKEDTMKPLMIHKTEICSLADYGNTLT